jgi:hypothetical protein
MGPHNFGGGNAKARGRTGKIAKNFGKNRSEARKESMRLFIHTARFILRDFLKSDRAGFISYQTDPRYQRLYSFKSSDTQRATELFDLFIAWQNDDPRRNFQVGSSNKTTNGCVDAPAFVRRDEMRERLSWELSSHPIIGGVIAWQAK